MCLSSVLSGRSMLRKDLAYIPPYVLSPVYGQMASGSGPQTPELRPEHEGLRATEADYRPRGKHK
jgi:hypothetical protein